MFCINLHNALLSKESVMKSNNAHLVSSAVQIFEISNRIVTSVFDSIRNEHNYSKFLNTYRHRFLTYLTEWCRFFTLATMPSNQQNLLLTMVQVLYLLEVFILAHYGPPSTETPTTETAIVRCHKNSWIYLTSIYYWWLLRPTYYEIYSIQFEIKKTLFAQDSIVALHFVVVQLPYSYLMLPLHWTLASNCIYLISPETRVRGLNFCRQ